MADLGGFDLRNNVTGESPTTSAAVSDLAGSAVGRSTRGAAGDHGSAFSATPSTICDAGPAAAGLSGLSGLPLRTG